VPIEVGRFTTEVTALEGDLPLTAAQTEKLVQLVLRRLEEKQREQQLAREATVIRRQAAPPARAGW
jgi:hypothetical protein